jgi:hypothetical protein
MVTLRFSQGGIMNEPMIHAHRAPDLPVDEPLPDPQPAHPHHQQPVPDDEPIPDHKPQWGLPQSKAQL